MAEGRQKDRDRRRVRYRRWREFLVADDKGMSGTSPRKGLHKYCGLPL